MGNKTHIAEKMKCPKCGERVSVGILGKLHVIGHVIHDDWFCPDEDVAMLAPNNKEKA